MEECNRHEVKIWMRRCSYKMIETEGGRVGCWGVKKI